MEKICSETIKKIVAMRANGNTYKQIRQETGLSKGTLSLYLKGKPSGTIVIPTELDKDTIEKIRELRKLNKTYAQIAQEMGISVHRIQKHCKDIVVERKKRTTPAASPFNGYEIYGPYYCDSAKRNKVILIRGDEKIQMTWTRYLMSIKMGRILDIHEHVDHIDDHTTHDDISNLQVLFHGDHARKTLKDKGRLKTIVTIRCPECGKIFESSPGHTHLVLKSQRTFCCRKCSSTYYTKKPRIDPKDTIISIVTVPMIA